VYAQLLIEGKNYGLHVFMVQVRKCCSAHIRSTAQPHPPTTCALWSQLRDEHLRPLPGIEVGDVGTKMGELMIDIGCGTAH
jgi:hypothetical protein